MAAGIEAHVCQTIRDIAPGLTLRSKDTATVLAADRTQMKELIAMLLDESALRSMWVRSYLGERMIHLQDLAKDSAYFTGSDFAGPLALPMYQLGACRSFRVHQEFAVCAQAPTFPAAIGPLPLPIDATGQSIIGWLPADLQRAVHGSPATVRFEFWELTDTRMTAVILATRLYLLDHGGQLPESLADLVPAYLPCIPVDPMSPMVRCWNLRRIVPCRRSTALETMAPTTEDRRSRTCQPITTFGRMKT